MRRLQVRNKLLSSAFVARSPVATIEKHAVERCTALFTQEHDSSAQAEPGYYVGYFLYLDMLAEAKSDFVFFHMEHSSFGSKPSNNVFQFGELKFTTPASPAVCVQPILLQY